MPVSPNNPLDGSARNPRETPLCRDAVRLPLLRYVLCMTFLAVAAAGCARSMERIVLNEDRAAFMLAASGEPFTPWGFNYDHDDDLRLLEEYWVDEWERVVGDFQTMRELGANVVRVHLQTSAFMSGPYDVNEVNMRQLARLIDLAETTGLYLNLTGLGSYRKDRDPAWYSEMDEPSRWAVHARFWQAVAGVCVGRSAVFCYNLMNEPVLTDNDEWVPGEGLAGLYYVQSITREIAGRTRSEIARAWVDTLVEAIRREDGETLITVGVIPWVFHWGGGSPLFYSEEVRENLDFASVHFYPVHGEVDKALEALAAYDVGMPLVIEETFPLRCGMDELADFIDRSRGIADGWLGFFWGGDIEYYAERARPMQAEQFGGWGYQEWLEYYEAMGDDFDEELRAAVGAYLMYEWLTYFRETAPRMRLSHFRRTENQTLAHWVK